MSDIPVVSTLYTDTPFTDERIEPYMDEMVNATLRARDIPWRIKTSINLCKSHPEYTQMTEQECLQKYGGVVMGVFLEPVKLDEEGHEVLMEPAKSDENF